MELYQIRELSEKIKENISKVIVGKDEVIDLILVSILCSGHILLEDIPGVGKTMLAKCLAKSINCDFKRIQFTPDLLPSDLSGINFYNQKEGEFVFRPGPIFTNIILADEINRATPRTQSSLLECMDEGQVTVDGETRIMSKPFLVVATQNPVEIQGTFPLPEAQLDRFFMRLKMGYPSVKEGKEILERFRDQNPYQDIGSVAEAAEIIEAQKSLGSVKVNEVIMDYILEIIEKTRNNDRISLGVSPRGSIALMKAAKAYAVIQSRNFVTPDDVKHVAIPVLSHRIIVKSHGAMSRGIMNAEMILTDILKEVPVPVEVINI